MSGNGKKSDDPAINQMTKGQEDDVSEKRNAYIPRYAWVKWNTIEVLVN